MKRTTQQLTSAKSPLQHPQPGGDLKQHVLRWLLHYPLQRIQDIAVGLDSGERTMARMLQSLLEEQYVDHVTPSLKSGSRHGWYYLTTAGLKKIAELEGGDPVTLARFFRADERHLLRLLPRFQQIVTLQNSVQSLVCSSPVALSSAGSPAEIRWGWQREYLVTLKTKRRVIRCEADAAVVLRRRAPGPSSPEQFFTLLVYLDLGQLCAFTDRATMLRKLYHILLYRESQERQPYRSMFPCVLILVESARQLELWQQAAMEAARQLRLGKPLAGVIVNLAAEPGYGHPVAEKEGARSMWNANFRHLVTNARCHLQEMLVPMTAAAVPPGIITDFGQNRSGTTPPARVLPSGRKILVKGHYHERLEDLRTQASTGSVLSSTQERELVALLGLQMSERYREIVLLLYANPLLSTAEIAVLSGLHTRTAERYLLTLEQWGCTLRLSQSQPTRETVQHKTEVEESTPPMEFLALRWVLSVRGLRYLAASMNASETTVLKRQQHAGGTASHHTRLSSPEHRLGTPLSQTSNGQRTNSLLVSLPQPGVLQLYREWAHTAGVYQCVIAFYRAAALQPGHSIAWFETHFRCARRYRVNRVWHNFRPDAVVEYVVKQERGTQRLHLWLEWDNGTTGGKALREKMQAYHFYMRSLEWRRRINTGAIPLLLIIVPDRSRQGRMTRLLQEVFSSATLHVRITSQELLREYGPLGTIWTEVFPIPPEHPSRLRWLLDMATTDESALLTHE